VSRGECQKLTGELLALLDDLRLAHADAASGVELVARFYETDHAVFNHCDDGSGGVGDVYRKSARDLFVTYACACEQKLWLRERVLSLLAEDEFQVRGALVERAKEFLDEPYLLEMTERLFSLVESEPEGKKQRLWLSEIESLARQLGDPVLFEQARVQADPDLPPAACFDIAEAYLTAGDARSARAWLDRIPGIDPARADERARMRQAIRELLGESHPQDDAHQSSSTITDRSS
jgi:hypothetical protein